MCCQAYLLISVHQTETLLVPLNSCFVLFNDYVACKEEEEKYVFNHIRNSHFAFWLYTEI